MNSNKFNYKNKIGEFKYIDIRDLANNIRNNTISERDAKKNLNALNTIKNAEIKFKKLTPKQKELLNLFNDLLNIILTDKTLESEIQEDKNKNENEDEDDDYENKNEDDYENEDDNDETMSQNEIIKNLNDILDEIIDKSKSFEEQIKSIRKVENLNEHYYMEGYGDKELEFKIFKIKLAHLSNEIDEKLFEQIFGHTIETLANKLINTTNK